MRMKKKRGRPRKFRAAKKRLFGVIVEQEPLRLEDILGMTGYDIPFVESENAPRYAGMSLHRNDSEESSQLLTGHL